MRNCVFAALMALALPAVPVFAQPAPEPAAPAAAEVRLPHISIRSIGSGPPVVLIPGLASPRDVWSGVAPGLARERRVLLVQVNGFAGDDPGANLRPGILEGIVADLHAYLERERLGPVRLVGHSMGGLAGLMFARTHPAQVERLMVVDALPFFSVLLANGGPEPTVATAEPMARMMRDRIRATHGQPADPAAIEASVRGLALKPASLERMRGWAAAADPRVTAQALYEDMITDLRPDLLALRTPVTVVVPWSGSQGFGRDATLAFYRRQFAGTRDIAFVDVAEAGHFVMLDQPEAFEAALSAFLAEPR